MIILYYIIKIFLIIYFYFCNVADPLNIYINSALIIAVINYNLDMDENKGLLFVIKVYYLQIKCYS